MDLKERVNLGSYYTPDNIVKSVYDMFAKNHIHTPHYTILDTSCGDLSFKPNIGADINSYPLSLAKEKYAETRIFNHNSLVKLSRKDYGLSTDEKLIIVGNPPYNDTTSLNKKEMKIQAPRISKKILKRDLGMSFLLSYTYLSPDYICVLHPLSYLIKKTNFSQLSDFFKDYRLIDNSIINSQIFTHTSKTTSFPIIIALYQKNAMGMSYVDICNTRFFTEQGYSFALNDFDYVKNYIDKYPNHKKVPLNDTVAHFCSLRDINALKRNRSFIEKETRYSVRITQDKLYLYEYVDLVKKNIHHFPYYLGNLDIPINLNTLKKKNYFKHLLGEHYI